MSDRLAHDHAGLGEAALARGEWARARDAFEAALATDDSPEVWEGLGWAAWWLADAELTMRAREQAYGGFRRRGDCDGAARVAGWLASDFVEFRGEKARAQGWLERAHTLLDDGPERVGHAWLAVHEAALVGAESPERAQELAEAAVRIGRAHDDADLEAVGLAQQGAALVGQGRVTEGMRLLDQASAIAVAEDLTLPISVGWTVCCTITACDGVGDFRRAAQWCEAMRTFASRWGGRQLLGTCRTAYGRVLASAGDWRAAEDEWLAAVDDFNASRPGMAAPGLVRLGELRARQGRADEARALFEQAAPYAPALVGLGELALEQGDALGAADAAERVLRRLPTGALLARLPALELLARARASEGDSEAAARAAAGVAAVAAAVDTPYLRARSLLLVAEVALARGEYDAARRAAEDAADCFGESSAPYERALARDALARALERLGRAGAAAEHAAAAQETFEALGAEREARRRRGDGQLTERELEVLRLVAQGLPDAEIAERLVVSPHTVHRHVANVRTKLRLPSRAAAVAHAAKEGLL